MVRPFQSLRIKVILMIIGTLVVMEGGSYWYIVQKQTDQYIETIKEQAMILTHALVKSIQHDMKGTCQKDIQAIFERVGIIPDIESLRIFDENGRVSKSADPSEVGLTIEDIGYEIFKANIPSTPYRGGHGYNAFCMVETIRNEESCRSCHPTKSPIIGIFELCLSMEKTDKKIADNRRFLWASATLTILFVIALLSTFFALQVNRPIGRLVKVMRRAEDGDITVRADIQRDDELGRLSRSFNAMMERLNQTQKEIETYHTEQLIRADRLATIGELAAGVAHEIKNPLAGISGAVQVLADDFSEKDPRRIITDQIIKQTQRMDKTIHDLLNFAQPLEAQLTEVDVNAVFEAGLFICLPNPAAAGIAVERNLAPGLPRLLIDPMHLQQIFINVILNAVQAMPGGGVLSLSTAAVSGAEEGGPAAGNVIRVTVGDTGGGIPPESADKIYNPFYTTKTEGTGLGLSITQRILKMHRGTISYRTEPGKGTTFVIDLPHGPAEPGVIS
jgi:two-component system NtrC family sensor kinase